MIWSPARSSAPPDHHLPRALVRGGGECATLNGDLGDRGHGEMCRLTLVHEGPDPQSALGKQPSDGLGAKEPDNRSAVAMISLFSPVPGPPEPLSRFLRGGAIVIAPAADASRAARRRPLRRRRRPGQPRA